MATIGTINEEGINVDLYIPRKCDASNTLIPAFDYAAIQLNIGEISPDGVYTGSSKTLCIAGFLRAEAESDHAVNRLCISNGIIRARTAKPKKQKKRLPPRQPAGQKGGRGGAARPAGRPTTAGQKRGPGGKPTTGAPKKDYKKDGAKPAAGDKKAPAAEKKEYKKDGAKPAARKPAQKK